METRCLRNWGWVWPDLRPDQRAAHSGPSSAALLRPDQRVAHSGPSSAAHWRPHWFPLRWDYLLRNDLRNGFEKFSRFVKKFWKYFSLIVPDRTSILFWPVLIEMGLCYTQDRESINWKRVWNRWHLKLLTEAECFAWLPFWDLSYVPCSLEQQLNGLVAGLSCRKFIIQPFRVVTDSLSRGECCNQASPIFKWPSPAAQK